MPYLLFGSRLNPPTIRPLSGFGNPAARLAFAPLGNTCCEAKTRTSEKERHMRPAKIVAIVIGAILVLVGFGLIAPGGFLLWAYGTQRDAAGFFESSNRVISSSGYALTAPEVDLHIGSDLGWTPKGATASVRIRAASASDTAIFIGIGPSTEVSTYLNGVEHDEVSDFGWTTDSVDYRHFAGGPPPSPPGEQDFWVASQEGPGSQTLEWDVRDGTWTAVIMNADGAQTVVADVSLGARFDILLPIAIGLTIGGIVLLAVGVLLIVLGARRPRWPSRAYPPQAAPGPYGYPMHRPSEYPADWPRGYPGERPTGYPPPWPEENQPYGPPQQPQQQPPHESPKQQQPPPFQQTEPQPPPQPQESSPQSPASPPEPSPDYPLETPPEEERG